jgi:hypothetical protein
MKKALFPSEVSNDPLCTLGAVQCDPFSRFDGDIVDPALIGVKQTKNG